MTLGPSIALEADVPFRVLKGWPYLYCYLVARSDSVYW